MAYQGDEKAEVNEIEHPLDLVRRTCKQRMEQLHEEMRDADEMSKVADARRRAIAEELGTIERILAAFAPKTPTEDADVSPSIAGHYTVRSY